MRHLDQLQTAVSMRRVYPITIQVPECFPNTPFVNDILVILPPLVTCIVNLDRYRLLDWGIWHPNNNNVMGGIAETWNRRVERTKSVRYWICWNVLGPAHDRMEIDLGCYGNTFSVRWHHSKSRYRNNNHNSSSQPFIDSFIHSLHITIISHSLLHQFINTWNNIET